jgi:spore coat polysaccharide biosynthesis protein SpsF
MSISHRTNKPKTTAIIQARMASSRLAGKVLLDIGGEPMLVRVIERTRRATLVDEVVVATTTDPSDDLVSDLCQARGYPHYRGSVHDVLDRYYQAAKDSSSQVIVRITADCPVIDPQVIDRIIEEFWGSTITQNGSGENLTTWPAQPAYDFAANRLPPPWGRTYPIGLDTEVCTFNGLDLAWKEATLPHQREHVMPFFYEQPDRFRILLVNHEVDFGALRWTVDTPEDLDLMQQIYAKFNGRDDFSWLEILDLIKRHPELGEINAQVSAKDYRAVDARREGASS